MNCCLHLTTLQCYRAFPVRTKKQSKKRIIMDLVSQQLKSILMGKLRKIKQ